jgi:16S rRNA (adenine(1408)-N(1))-methyltransferase
MFVQAAVEDLPSELNAVASEVFVNFPWGSLLQVVAGGKQDALLSLRRICAIGALLTVTVGLDPARDRTEIERLQLPMLSDDYIDSTLESYYRAAGFKIIPSEMLGDTDPGVLETSWAKRLRGNSKRSVVHLVARAIEIPDVAVLAPELGAGH